jgi:hypothetical protein
MPHRKYSLVTALALCVTIVASAAVQAAPEVADVAIEATSPHFLIEDDLWVSYTLIDATTVAVAWYVNGAALTELHLPIEGGSVNAINDYSGNSHPTTAVGSVSTAWQASGGHDGNGTLAFGSSFYINAGDVFPVSGSYTKAAWVKRNDVNASNNILSSTAATGGHVLYASQSQGFRLSAGQVGSWNIVQDPTPLAPDVWYHVAVTYDYGTGDMILYKNGSVVDSDVVPIANRDITDPTLLVGAFANSSQWNGYLDDVRLFNRVLPPEQIAELYQDGQTVASEMTALGDEWEAEVTPFSTTEAGVPVLSTAVTIQTGQPSVGDIPDQTIAEGESFAPIDLNSLVSDPNHLPSEMTWTYSGAVDLTVVIVSGMATITTPHSDWYGTETITFRATDPDGLWDEDDAVFEVTPVNDPPVVSDIPGQTIQQGETFSVIYLDNYVDDVDNPDETIVWTVYGNEHLDVVIESSDRSATITVVDPLWFGTETITFRATDTGGLYDESQATFEVEADPIVENVVLTASSSNPLTDDDLIISYDLGGSAVTAAVSWYVNGNAQMVLYLPFEGGAAGNLTDYSGNAHTVTTFGNPVWSPDAGPDGYGAWILDGNDHLDAGDVFPTLSSYTKVAWVKRTGNGSNNILSGSSGHVFFASSSSQNNQLAAGHNGTFNIVKDSEPLEVDVWYHVAVSFDYQTGEMVLYKNGMEVDRDTASVSQREMTDSRLYIGAFGGSSQIPGAFGEVRIYDYVLAEEQIVNLYNGTPTLHSSETDVLDEWYAEVTPFAADETGVTVFSNTLQIGFVNHPPQLDAVDDQAIDVNRLLEFSVTASDPDPGQVPMLLAELLPEGADFSDLGEGIGGFSWVPDFDQYGLFEVRIIAVDDSSRADTQLVQITVYPDTVAPGIALLSPPADSLTTDREMLLSMSVQDENPMTVIVYCDTVESPGQKVFVGESVTSGDVEHLLTAMPMQPDVSATMGLWHFDDAQGTVAVDAGPHSLSGTLTGAVVWAVSGRFGHAVGFDGTSGCVTIPDDPALDVPVNGALTIEAWVYPDASGAGRVRSIVSKRAYMKARTVNYEMLINSNNRLMFGAGQGATVIHSSDVVVPADQWSHVAIAVDGIARTAVFYLNHVAVDTVSGVDLGPTHDEALYIGSAGPSSETFVGRIDEVRLTNRILTPEELQRDSRLNHGVYYWHAEAIDGSGNVQVSEPSQFTVYAPEESAPQLVFPTDVHDPAFTLYDVLPTLEWTPWIGPGPLDTIHYAVHFSFTASFAFEAVVDSLTETSLLWIDSLDFGSQYWWYVKASVHTDSGQFSAVTDTAHFRTWTLGDVNNDRSVNVTDLTYLVTYLFQGGQEPQPRFTGDMNGDCSVNVTDLTYLVAYLFGGGSAPMIGCE